MPGHAQCIRSLQGRGSGRGVSQSGASGFTCRHDRLEQEEFDFEYGNDYGAHIDKVDPQLVKVLVRYNPEADAVMTTVQVAISAGLPYTALRDAILTHPTMAEGLGVLLAGVPAVTETKRSQAA